MCYGCYEKYGKPTIVNDKVRRAVKLIAAVDDENPIANALHIVIEDWNLEDDHVEYCMGVSKTAAEKECSVALLEMTEDERASAMALFDQFIDETGRNMVE